MYSLLYLSIPKLANVSEGARGTVSNVSIFLALSHGSSAIHVVHPKILGRWDMFSARQTAFGAKTAQNQKIPNT
jgi:hypothetical protein